MISVTEARTGRDCDIAPSVEFVAPDGDADAARIGDGATIRSGSIVYPDVVIGDDLTTGHNAVIREHTTLGDHVVVGTNAVIDGTCTVGSGVSMQTGVYVPPESAIGDRVFLGPHAVLTNDPYPLRRDVDLAGPTLERDVSIGANATVLPDVTVGERSFVAAGAVVTEDVPPETLAAGVPATHRPLPEALHGDNG
ncbi:MAG: DapH/DapD/GlmU-related protein [Haloarculaceae archaeon]